MLFSAWAGFGATVLDAVFFVTGDFSGYLHSIGVGHGRPVVNLLLPGFHGIQLEAGIIGSVSII